MTKSGAMMIGLVGAGKTTFLAALYHVVESGSVPGSLILEKMPPLREHLERIRNDWLTLIPQTRTTAHVLDQNILEMRGAESAIVPFYFPDLAGEKLTALVEERICSPELAALMSEVDRLLLFIHPDGVVESPTIDDVVALVRALEEDGNKATVQNVPGDAAESEGVAHAIPWESEMLSTQVKLVDLLQIVMDLSSGLKKIAVVVSAWDRVQHLGEEKPQEWLAARLPMLSQYLTSISPEIPVRVFGVSAVGGDLERDREALRKIVSPVDRICVVGVEQQEDRRDITLPVKWLAS
jgi:hypothetical protein